MVFISIFSDSSGVEHVFMFFFWEFILFAYLLSWLLTIKLQEYFIHFGSKSFISNLQIFSPILWIVIYLHLDSVIWNSEILDFDKIWLNFSFYCLVLWVRIPSTEIISNFLKVKKLITCSMAGSHDRWNQPSPETKGVFLYKFCQK